MNTNENIQPEIDDYIISDERAMSSRVYCKEIGDAEDMDVMVQAISDRMEREQYWPNVWYTNDHGNVDLLSISRDDNGVASYTVKESWV